LRGKYERSFEEVDDHQHSEKKKKKGAVTAVMLLSFEKTSGCNGTKRTLADSVGVAFEPLKLMAEDVDPHL